MEAYKLINLIEKIQSDADDAAVQIRLADLIPLFGMPCRNTLWPMDTSAVHHSPNDRDLANVATDRNESNWLDYGVSREEYESTMAEVFISAL